MSAPPDPKPVPPWAWLSAEDRSLLERVPRPAWGANGFPDPERGARMRRAAAAVGGAVGGAARIRHSPLGPEWSEDIDVHGAGRGAPAALVALGWVPLDGLLGRLGIRGRGRWAVVEAGQILARAEVHASPAPDPVRAVLDRCRRRREVRVREVLELRSLLRSGSRLPSNDRALAVAARAEAGLGGRELARWADGSPLPCPAPLARGREERMLGWARGAAGRWRRAIRRRLVVAVSGVDGAGKSTLIERLQRDLERVGAPASRVWTRPGMRMEWIEGAARWVKARLGQSRVPGVERVAGGESPAALASRRGPLGWAWTLLVTLSFLFDVRRRLAAGRGVVLFDRHLLDALVTLDVFYAGVDTRVHRALVRMLLPRASLTIYLDVPAGVAVDRKRDDAFGQLAVRRQLAGYATRMGELGEVRVLDGTRPLDELALDAFEMVAREASR